ncbi:MAG: hypothetical protein ACRD44_07580 [Bryobacteraceae bacterium]
MLVAAAVCTGQNTSPQGPINVLFVIHTDPLAAPEGKVSKAAYESQRDNLAWLADYFNEIERKRGREFVPMLTLEIAGDHAEYYSVDPVGFALLKRLHARGHELGIHFHTNYKAGPHHWLDGRSDNTPEMRRRVTEDHIREVDALVAKIIGSNDPAIVRKTNHTIQGHFLDNAIALDKGFYITTTGQSEVFNNYFDHDPLTPWRLPSLRPGVWQLAEDRKGPWIMLPGAAVLGIIGKHVAWLDLSPVGMRRKFLQVYLEWRAAQLAPDRSKQRVWVLGWHEHTANIAGDDGRYGDRQNLRDEVVEFVTWLNENFINRRASNGSLIARYATADTTATAFKNWEGTHTDQSSFNYPGRTTDWNAYPHQLPGLARQLMFAQHEGEVPGFSAKRVQVHRLRKTDGPNWSVKDGKIVNSSRVWPIYLMWSDDGEKTFDFSGTVAGSMTCVDAAKGAEMTVKPTAVRVGTTPIVCAAAP